MRQHYLQTWFGIFGQRWKGNRGVLAMYQSRRENWTRPSTSDNSQDVVERPARASVVEGAAYW